MTDSQKHVIENLKKTIEQVKNNESIFYFFVVDSKNVPNGSMEYIYRFAKHLYDRKYNVKMIYQLENEYTDKELKQLKKQEKPIDETRVFTGVSEWLGKEYEKLPHVNISKEEWKTGPADFLFIPEAFASLMKVTYRYKAACKRIVILHNYNYITEFIPYGDEWGSYGITNVLCNTNKNADLIKKVFPYVKTKVLNPSIGGEFRNSVEPAKLIVNLYGKSTNDITHIIKQFYWKYPVYKFVTFRDLRGYSKAELCEMLKESAITVWMDRTTPFGQTALEAIKCHNIVIGLIPDIIPEWMEDKEKTIKNCGIWTYDLNTIPDILANVIGSWMQDDIPAEIVKEIEKVSKLYTEDEWEQTADKIIDEYKNERLEELKEIRVQLESNYSSESATTNNEEKPTEE